MKIRPVVLAAALVLPACSHAPATVLVDGKQVPRLTQEYVGQPYTVRHRGAHPRPGGASAGLRGPGGRISGIVCGADVSFEVEHQGDHIQLTGFADPGAAGQEAVDSHLRVEDRDGRRLIQGQIGTRTVDVSLLSNAILGVAGISNAVQDPFHLVQRGDELVGDLRLRIHQGQVVHVRLTGRDALWALPAADQAVVLPLILMCVQADRGLERMLDPAPLGFGGTAGSLPRGTLTFHRF